MKLYSYFRSTSAWRVRIVLAYKSIPYEYVAVNLSPDALGQLNPAYASVNPMRQVPTLEWTEGGSTIRLTQSVAIAEYLEETCPSPPLLPKDPLLRAQTRRAVEIVNSGIQPLQNSATIARVREIGGEFDVEDWIQAAMTRGLSALDGHARAVGGRFSIADHPSLADVYLVPQLFNARRFGVDIERYGKLLEIEAQVNELPAFKEAHPDAQPDAPRKGPSNGTVPP